MADVKWWRVKDRASPFYGLDFSGKHLALEESFEDKDGPWQRRHDVLAVKAVRRLDVVLGDRPLQIPKVVGIFVSTEILAPSPVQDDVVEITTDAKLYGAFVCEQSIRLDGATANVVLFQKAVICALVADSDGVLLASDMQLGEFYMDPLQVHLMGLTAEELREELSNGSWADPGEWTVEGPWAERSKEDDDGA